MNYLIFILLIHLFLPQKSISLTILSNKTREELTSVIGPATKVESFATTGNRCQCQRVFYLDDRLAITFIEGRATWFWVYKGLELTDSDIRFVRAYFNFGNYKLYKLNYVDDLACCPDRS